MLFNYFRRCRNVQPTDSSPYELVPDTLIINDDSITVDIINNENEHLFIFKLEALQVKIKYFLSFGCCLIL